ASASELMERGLPTFGICLGHQIMALACGAQTRKMKFGHHGANHPVKDLSTGRIAITSQNHGFNVDMDSLPGAGTTMTHVNLYDGTAEGLENRSMSFFSVQYHPEASPGPHESRYLFARFSQMMDAKPAAAARRKG
ncbi:MAG TPA: gamma-glutamyl-gamma-aminobutyrate hydrolase family protein, partial [Spirochaetia bacterium]|nr:gamma-glutamyl-gamma-aminobutyrate hydrolase family protein [Spirochaetia bacterium]